MEPDLRLQKKQLEAARYWLDDETEELLFGGAKGGAKTNLGCSLIFGDGLTYPETYYFIARKNLHDLIRFTTPSVYEVFQLMRLDPLKYIRYNGYENAFHLWNGSKVFYLDCKYLPSDPDFHRFGSYQFTRGWAEEIGQIDSKAIVNLGTTVGRWKNDYYNLKRKFLLTCNPYKGYAFGAFYLPQKAGTLEPIKKFVRALPTDNKYLPEDYLKVLDRLPENERQRLRLGNWEYDDDPTVMISMESILNMYSNAFAVGGEKYIIADIARFGSDRAIITVWDGLRLIDRVSFDKSATTEIQTAISALMVRHKVQLSRVLVDEDGVGGGVKDNLHCVGFLNNGRPKNKIYQNLKTECGYKLAELANEIWIADGEPVLEMGTDKRSSLSLSLKEKEDINQELGMLKTFEADKDGKLRILPKTKIKEQIGRSPDWLDCFIMRMYFEIFSAGYAVQ